MAENTSKQAGISRFKSDNTWMSSKLDCSVIVFGQKREIDTIFQFMR